MHVTATKGHFENIICKPFFLPHPRSKFYEFEPRLESSKNRFQLSAGLIFFNLDIYLKSDSLHNFLCVITYD